MRVGPGSRSPRLRCCPPRAPSRRRPGDAGPGRTTPRRTPCSWRLPSAPSQPLTIWMRSRFAGDGVLERRHEEATATCPASAPRRAGRPPIGTPRLVADVGGDPRSVRASGVELVARRRSAPSSGGRSSRRSRLRIMASKIDARGCSPRPRRRRSPSRPSDQPAYLRGRPHLGHRGCDQRLRSRLRAGVLAEEVVLLGGGQAGVAVGRADHAELVGVGAELLSPAAARSSSAERAYSYCSMSSVFGTLRSRLPGPRSRSRRTRRPARARGGSRRRP